MRSASLARLDRTLSSFVERVARSSRRVEAKRLFAAYCFHGAVNAATRIFPRHHNVHFEERIDRVYVEVGSDAEIVQPIFAIRVFVGRARSAVGRPKKRSTVAALSHIRTFWKSTLTPNL